MDDPWLCLTPYLNHRIPITFSLLFWSPSPSSFPLYYTHLVSILLHTGSNCRKSYFVVYFTTKILLATSLPIHPPPHIDSKWEADAIEKIKTGFCLLYVFLNSLLCRFLTLRRRILTHQWYHYCYCYTEENVLFSLVYLLGCMFHNDQVKMMIDTLVFIHLPLVHFVYASSHLWRV